MAVLKGDQPKIQTILECRHIATVIGKKGKTTFQVYKVLQAVPLIVISSPVSLDFVDLHRVSGLDGLDDMHIRLPLPKTPGHETESDPISAKTSNLGAIGDPLIYLFSSFSLVQPT